jgi:lysophospholipid acyltransferase
MTYSTMITFLTSAFWHGIAGGYYIAFAFAGFIQIAMRLCRSNFRPLFLTVPPSPAFTAGTKDTPASYRVTQAQPTALKPVYDVASIFVSVLVLNYTAAPFMLLSIKDSLLVWGRLGWYGQVLVFGALAFFWSGGGRLLRSKNVNKAVVQGEKVAGKVGEQVGQNITVAKGKVGEVVDQVAKGNGVASEMARTLKAQ